MVVGVELFQRHHQLGQDAHGEGAGAAGRIERLEVLDGGHQGVGLGGAEVVASVGMREQAAQTLVQALLLAAIGQCTNGRALPCGGRGRGQIQLAGAGAQGEHLIDRATRLCRFASPRVMGWPSL